MKLPSLTQFLLAQHIRGRLALPSPPPPPRFAETSNGTRFEFTHAVRLAVGASAEGGAGAGGADSAGAGRESENGGGGGVGEVWFPDVVTGSRRLEVNCASTTSVSTWTEFKGGIPGAENQYRSAWEWTADGCLDIGAVTITFTQQIVIGSLGCTSCPSIKISGAMGAVLSGGGATKLFDNYGTLQLEGPMTIRDGYVGQGVVCLRAPRIAAFVS